MPDVGTNLTGSSNAMLSMALGAVRIPRERFKALDIAPRLRGKGQALSVEWPERTDRDDLDEGVPDRVLQPLSEKAPAHMLGMDYTPKSDYLERYAFGMPLTDAEVAHWETVHDIDMENDALVKGATAVANVLERKVMTLVTTNGSYANTSDPGNYNTTSTPIITPIRAAIQEILDENGDEADTALMDSATADQLLLQDEVQAHNSRGHGVAVPGDYDTLRAFFKSRFNLDLIIHRGKYGNSGTLTSYVPGSITIACVRGMNRPWMRTLVNESVPAGVDGVAAVYEFRQENPRSTVYIAEARFKPRVMFTTAAYRLTGVLAS